MLLCAGYSRFERIKQNRISTTTIKLVTTCHFFLKEPKKHLQNYCLNYAALPTAVTC